MANRFDRFFETLKNHPVASVVLIAGAIVIALGDFRDAACGLTGLCKSVGPPSAQLVQPPVDSPPPRIRVVAETAARVADSSKPVPPPLDEEAELQRFREFVSAKRREKDNAIAALKIIQRECKTNSALQSDCDLLRFRITSLDEFWSEGIGCGVTMTPGPRARKALQKELNSFDWYRDIIETFKTRWNSSDSSDRATELKSFLMPFASWPKIRGATDQNVCRLVLIRNGYLITP